MSITKTYSLAVGYSMTVQADGHTSGQVVRLSDQPGAGDPASPVQVNPNRTIIFGPFDVTTRFAVTSDIGDLTVTTSSSVRTTLRNVNRTYRLQRPKYAVLGDSRMNLGSQVNSVSSGNGRQYDNRASGIQATTMMLTNGAVEFPMEMNFGVQSSNTFDLTQTTFANTPAGTPLTTILPQVMAKYANMTYVDAVIASGADGVILLSGTNDRTLTGAAYMDANASLGFMQSAIAKLLANSIHVILIAELPRGDSTNTTKRLAEPNLSDHLAFANLLRQMRGTPGIDVVDAWPELCDPASTVADAILGKTSDGLHPGNDGAYDLAVKIAAILNKRYSAPPLLPSSNADLWTAGNPYGSLQSNPMVLGTTGTFSGVTIPTGQAATGYIGASSSATGLTMTFSKVAADAATDVPERQRLTVTGTPTASSPLITFNQRVNATTNTAAFNGLAAGDKIKSFGRVDIIGTCAGLLGAYLSTEIRDSAANVALQARSMAGTTVPMRSQAAGYGGVHETEVLTLPSGLINPFSGLAITEMRIGYEIRFVQNVACNIVVDFWPTWTGKLAQ